jgi:hypothetical protein
LCGGKTVYSNYSNNHVILSVLRLEIFYFEIDNLDFLKDKISGNISSFQLEIKGVCSEHCADDE